MREVCYFSDIIAQFNYLSHIGSEFSRFNNVLNIFFIKSRFLNFKVYNTIIINNALDTFLKLFINEHAQNTLFLNIILFNNTLYSSL